RPAPGTVPVLSSTASERRDLRTGAAPPGGRVSRSVRSRRRPGGAGRRLPGGRRAGASGAAARPPRAARGCPDAQRGPPGLLGGGGVAGAVVGVAEVGERVGLQVAV